MPFSVLRAGTLPDGDRRKISALLSGWRSLTRSSPKGMRPALSAIQGRKLQDEMFLSPMTSV